jgi:hypothetical protein
MRPQPAEPIGASGHATAASTGRTHDRKQSITPAVHLFLASRGPSTHGSSRRSRAPRHGPADRHTARRCPRPCRELGITRALEGADAVRLQVVGLPDALDRAQADPRRLGHGAAGPMGRRAGRLATGQRDHVLHRRATQRRLAGLAGGIAQQPVDASLGEPLLPAPHRRPADPTCWATRTTGNRSPEPRMIRARATCFWARLRSATIASSEARSSSLTITETSCTMLRVWHRRRTMWIFRLNQCTSAMSAAEGEAAETPGKLTTAPHACIASAFL